MKMKYLGALLFVTALCASCAVDGADEADVADETEASEVQSLGAGCTLLRPLSWNRHGVPCLEGYSTPLQMAHGASYTAHSIGSGIYGHGSATVVCNNGAIQQTSATCWPGVEN